MARLPAHPDVRLLARAATLIALCAAAIGCSDATRSRAAGELRGDQAEPGSPDTPQAPPPPPGSPPVRVLEYQASKFASGLVADDPPLTGSLEEGGRQDYLVVLKGAFCYRILGVGAESVEDMDLFLFDPNGVQTHQDPAQDRFPLLGKQADICPTVAGQYRVQVHMYKGGGDFAVRAYRTPM